MTAVSGVSILLLILVAFGVWSKAHDGWDILLALAGLSTAVVLTILWLWSVGALP